MPFQDWRICYDLDQVCHEQGIWLRHNGRAHRRVQAGQRTEKDAERMGVAGDAKQEHSHRRGIRQETKKNGKAFC